MRQLTVMYVVTMVLLASMSGAGLGTAAAAGNTELGVGNAPFGEIVSDFVHDIQNEFDGGIGHKVATFVLDNNPAAEMIPDHAGPPADNEPGPPASIQSQGNSSAEGTPTPGEGATSGSEDEPGPPDDPGGGGPPAKGPPTDRGDGNR